MKRRTKAKPAIVVEWGKYESPISDLVAAADSLEGALADMRAEIAARAARDAQRAERAS